MDFNKPIYGEVEGIINANVAKAYFKRHRIEYTEEVEEWYHRTLEDGRYAGSFYVFKFPEVTEEQLKEANKHTGVVFYQ